MTQQDDIRTYYLLEDPANGREIIDKEPLSGYKVTDTCQAKDFADAKRKFGFWWPPKLA